MYICIYVCVCVEEKSAYFAYINLFSPNYNILLSLTSPPLSTKDIFKLSLEL